MTFTSPNPFAEALAFIARKRSLPTALSSAEMRQRFTTQALNASMISARTMQTNILDAYRTNVEAIVFPQTIQRADRITDTNPEGNVSVALDAGTARMQLKALHRQNGYTPDPEDAGTLKDLASDARINLVLDTNKDIALGLGWYVQGQDQAVLDAFPCQELIRVEARNKVRDWPTRWLAAANSVGDTDALRIYGETQRMIARKDSPIWQALGDGAGGYKDSLGNPFPPFAFSSGEGVRDVSYTESVELGAIKAGDQIEPQPLDYPQPDNSTN